jgi:hypothetical protein
MKKFIVNTVIILCYAFNFNAFAQIYMEGVAPLEPGNFGNISISCMVIESTFSSPTQLRP